MKTAIIFCFAVLFCTTFVTARLGQRNLEVVSLTVQDFNVFAESLWDTLALGHEYEDFQDCMHQQIPAGILLARAIDNFNSSKVDDARIGLKRLGKVLQVITAAIVQCQVVAGSSFSIDGIEIFADINKIVSKCSKIQIGRCGAILGDAIGKVYYGQIDINSPETISKINAIPNLTWTAGVNPVFNRSNLWQFKRNRVSLRHVHSKKDAGNSTESQKPRPDSSGRRKLQTMPTAFDSRTTWPYCIHAIRDQGPCASCWAMASAEVLEDRFCIASNKAINTILGPQFQVSCDTSNKGCNGGYLKNAWNFLENYGIVTEKCFPYTSQNFVVPTCASFTRCQDGTAMRKYYAKQSTSRSFSGVAAIQQEIYTNGPVVAAMFVYSDFMSYTSGIYMQAWGSYVGGHAIKIIGWGQQNGVNYWIISNSWGQNWGETGHARIAFGQVGIESQGYAGLADLTRQ